MKKAVSVLFSLLLCVSLYALPAMAYSIDGGVVLDASEPLDEDGDDAEGDFTIENDEVSGTRVTGDEVELGQELYFKMEDGSGEYADISVDNLMNSNMFSFKLVRDKNCSLLDSVKATSKRLDGHNRTDYIMVSLKDSNRTQDVKMTFDVYFKAKYDSDSSRYDGKTVGTWESGDVINIRFELYVINSHEEDGGDANISTGEGVVIRPVSGDKNTIRWSDGDDVACLEFEASSDADDFFTRLSTKVDNKIYDNYGEPENADLFFRYFSGTNIDTTSRATLTLYNPWYDDRYVDPDDVHIYRKTSGGGLEDVSNQFHYVDEDDTDAGIDGWQCKLRTLGSYVLSDRRLDVDYNYGNSSTDDNYYNDDPNESLDGSGTVTSSSTPAQVTRPLPPTSPETGSHDFVSLALFGTGLGAVTILLERRKRKRK